ncbi:hypothetical protein GALMADRAFT_67618, partial [Galerina marginata CBS 339.88]
MYSSWLLSCMMVFSWLPQFWFFIWVFLWCNLSSLVSAAPTQQMFPKITFKAFNRVIESNFGSNISLATVLVILLSLVENTDLLNLHFRQQHPEYQGENKVALSGWIIAFTESLLDQLGKKKKTLLCDYESEDLSTKEGIKCIANKLDIVATKLDLTPYNSDGDYTGKLLPVSMEKLKPLHVICPMSFV